MFKKIIAEARQVIEGTGLPGKLSKKYDRGSRGADSFRSYTKKATNRTRRRQEKQQLADTPTRQTKGYSHATWPSNPVYTQKLYDKKKPVGEDSQRRPGSVGRSPAGAQISLASKIHKKGNGMFRSNKFATKSFQDTNAKMGMPKKLRSEENETPAESEHFTVHFKDGKQIGGKHKSRVSARRSVDRLDAKYGAYGHFIRDNTGKTRF